MPEQLIESINDTARMARTMLSLLLVAALVLQILSFSPDENLFRDVSVELPQIGIGISIKQSYIVAPLIFLYLHLQVLYLLSVLARKMRAFRELGPAARQGHFDRLSAFVFIQLFRDQHIPLFPWFLFWLGVVVIPLVLLSAMDLSFVRYQSYKITIWHHIVFIIDFVFVMWSVWAVWPSTDKSRNSRADTFRVVVRRVVIQAIPIKNIRIWAAIFVIVISVVFFMLYRFVDTTMEYSDLTFLVGTLIIFGGALIFYVEPRSDRVAYDQSIEIKMINGMMILTAVASVFMMIFLFHSVKPPHFDTETVEKDRECIWKGDGKKDDIVTKEDASCSNYIDRFLCKSLDICRYLDLRYKWLANTQTVDLASLITNESGDESAEYSRRWSVNNLHMADRSFRFAVFHDATLHGADFRKAKLEGADFMFAKLHSAEFPEAQLRNTKFRWSESINAVFDRSESQNADFSFSRLQGANFSGAQLQGSNFEDAKLTGAFFRNAELQDVNFKDARLYVTDFHEAELQGANFEGAILDGAESVIERSQGVNFSEEQLKGIDLGRIHGHDSWDKGTNNLAIWISKLVKLACRDGYTADRIFARWTKNSKALSDADNRIMRKKVFEALACERKKKDRSRCPGLQIIPDGRWSKWWAKFDYDLSRSSCTKSNPSFLSPDLQDR